MTNEQFSSLLDHIQVEERTVRIQAQSEYARDSNNVFANFDRLSSLLGTSREHILMVYAYKHLDGIISYVNGHKSQREDVRQRIKDLRLYLALLWGMVEDKEQKQEQQEQ